MNRKGLIAAAVALATVAGVALAGFDMYASKNYTTIIAPTVLTAGVAVSNSANSGVDCVGLQGVGALVIGYDCNDTAAATVTVVIQTSTTSNGVYTAAKTLTVTNGAAYNVSAIVPNNLGRFWRAVVTPGATTTNAEVGVLLVTE